MRTKCQLINQTRRDIVISDPNSRGSDWGDTVLGPGEKISANGGNAIVGSEGNPRAGETQHWGWIYFNLQAGDGYPSVRLQLYLCLDGNDGVVDAQLGYYDSGSSKDNPMPGGTIGRVEIVDNGNDPVIYSVFF